MGQFLESSIVLIDGSETYTLLKALRLELDFKALRSHFAGTSRLLRIQYYTSVPEDEAFCTQMPLLDWLEYNGYAVVKKSWRTEPATGRRRTPNIALEMTVDALTAGLPVQRVVLIANDTSLVATVRALKERGSRVTVIWSLHKDAPPVSDALRREADDFLDILSLEGILRSRPEPRMTSEASHPQSRAQGSPKRSTERVRSE